MHALPHDALGTPHTSRRRSHAGQPRVRKAPLPLSRCWTYARHVRDYERAYEQFETPAALFFAEESKQCSVSFVYSAAVRDRHRHDPPAIGTKRHTRRACTHRFSSQTAPRTHRRPTS